MINERVGVAISSLLASAVLQSSMTAQLAGVGYSTAIEYGFYGFFVVCVFCVGVALLIVQLSHSGRPRAARGVELVARGMYVTSVIGAFLAYYVLYGRGGS
jgi:Ni/Fe-hydrogenase subunit HybB-like protein